VLARQLRTPHALSHEIARLFVEAAKEEAHALMREHDTPSDQESLLDTLIRHEYQILQEAENVKNAQANRDAIAQLKIESAL
jgi:hypothetical protein